MKIINNNILKEFSGLFIFIILIGSIWIGITITIENDTPFFVVSSRSMIPVLDVGDIILVSGRNNYEDLKIDDIIVFTLPTDKDRVIVHRIHEIRYDEDRGIEIKTKGDHNPNIDGWTVLKRNYIGTVIFTIPSIGNITIWLSPPTNYYIITFIIIILLTKEVKNEEN